MLSIGKLAQGQEGYYLGKVAEGVEDYYVGGGEAPGRWVGSGSEQLGMEGQVAPEQLRRMLGGKSPVTGESLRHDNRTQGPGFDLTFSAPKSVSLLWAFSDPDVQKQVIDAHEKALESALGYLERNATFARRGAGGTQFVAAPKMLAAAFRHRTSRAGDPQVHTHVLVSSLVKAEDGRWSSLHSPSLYSNAKTAGYLYQAELRNRLARELGVGWGEIAKGSAEIEGFELATLAEFSTRRQEILSDQELVGSGTIASRQASAMATRKAKDYGVESGQLEGMWQARADQVGLTRQHVASLIEGPRDVGSPGLPARKLGEMLTADRSHFERKDVLMAICELAPDAANVRQIERAADHFLGMKYVQEIGEVPWGKVYSTPELIELENEFIHAAREGIDAGRCVASKDRVDATLQRMNLDPAAEAADPDPHLQKVTAQQREMVTRLTRGGEAIATVNGVAGAGKTYALEAVNQIFTAEGFPVIGATTSWRAADILSAESGIPTASIAARLHEWDWMLHHGHEPLAPGTVLVVDEAGMASTRDLAMLRRHIERVGGKYIAIGDYDQLPAVGAGGTFRAVYERHGVASMPYSRRQARAVDREIIDLIGRGQGTSALSLLQTENNVVGAQSRTERDQALVADWWEAFSQGKDSLMLAETNIAVDDLNEMARALMRQDGQLGEKELQLEDGRSFAQGDRVVTRVTDHELGIRNLQQWEVVDVDEKDLSLTLAGDDEKLVKVGPAYLSQQTSRGQAAIQHGYAVTGHVAQGSTHAEVFAQAGTYAQWTRTALSRAKDQMRLYAVIRDEPVDAELGPTARPSDWRDLASAMSRDNADTAAIDEPLRVEVAQMSERLLLDRRRQIDELGSVERESTQEQRRLQREASRRAERLHELRDQLDQAPEGLARIALENQLELAVEKERRAQADLAEYRSPIEPAERADRSAQAALIDRELTRRRQFKVDAARLNPPEYIETELGAMPDDGEAAAAWIRAVDDVEAHRQRYGINDQKKALGHESGNPERTRAAKEIKRSIEQARLTIEKRTDIQLEPVAVARESRPVSIEM